LGADDGRPASAEEPNRPAKIARALGRPPARVGPPRSPGFGKSPKQNGLVGSRRGGPFRLEGAPGDRYSVMLSCGLPRGHIAVDGGDGRHCDCGPGAPPSWRLHVKAPAEARKKTCAMPLGTNRTSGRSRRTFLILNSHGDPLTLPTRSPTGRRSPPPRSGAVI